MAMSHKRRDPSPPGNDGEEKFIDEQADSTGVNDSAEAAVPEAVSDTGEEDVQGQDAATEEALDKPGEPERSADVSAEAAAAESERYLRLAAEFDNYKKRTAREFEDILKRANARLLRDLIAIIDNFERALTVDPDRNDNAAYRKGVDLIYNQLLDLLKKEGVSAIETVGKPFDPNLHEALMQMESDDHDDGIICREILKGYAIDGKVLRHARVAVSRGKHVSDEKTNNNT